MREIEDKSKLSIEDAVLITVNRDQNGRIYSMRVTPDEPI